MQNEKVDQSGYKGHDRRPTEAWHLDKKVSISHIISTAVLAATIILYLADQDKRIDANAKDIQYNSQSIEQQETRINRSLDSINRKLDKLTDFFMRGGYGAP